MLGYVGEVGDHVRLEVDVVFSCKVEEGDKHNYPVYLNYMVSTSGYAVVAKSTKSLKRVARGERIFVHGVVNAHTVFEGEMQSLLTLTKTSRKDEIHRVHN